MDLEFSLAAACALDTSPATPDTSRMPSRQRLLLLQLPRLDPDVTTSGENVMLAAACLQNALTRVPD